MMKCTTICIFIVAFTVNFCTAKKLPSFIKRCKLADPVPEVSKCITQAALDLKPHLIKGIPEMKLPAIEPLHIPKLEVHAGNGTANGLTIIFEDVKAYGVKDFGIKKFVFDIEKPYMGLHLYIPRLYAQTTYTLNGRILLFELSSTGQGYMNLTDVESRSHHRKMSIITRNGKRYLNLEDDEIEFVRYKKGSLYLEDLFKDNEQLTEQTNKAINDNFEELTKEINPLLYESIRLLLLGIIKPVFDDYSLDELFE